MARPPQRDWGDAREKVAREGHCRVCKTAHGLQAAHIMGRTNDQRVGGKVWVNPHSIVPLCQRCHDQYDRRAQPYIDLSPYLKWVEERQAHEDIREGDKPALERVRRRVTNESHLPSLISETPI